MKSFSFILLKFGMHVTNKQFLVKFDNVIFVIFCILRQ